MISSQVACLLWLGHNWLWCPLYFRTRVQRGLSFLDRPIFSWREESQLELHDAARLLLRRLTSWQQQVMWATSCHQSSKSNCSTGMGLVLKERKYFEEILQFSSYDSLFDRVIPHTYIAKCFFLDKFKPFDGNKVKKWFCKNSLKFPKKLYVIDSK